jgi:tetratricopeptide (TPR) repeat protein
MRAPLTALLIALAAAAASASEAGRPAPDAAPDAAALVKELGAPVFGEREDAMTALVCIGEPALPALEAAAKSEDAEVRWRARAALRMIRWHVTERLREKAGAPFADYAKRPWYERERAAIDLSAIGGRTALPALGQILAREKSRSVQRAAAIGLLRMGPEGLLAIEEHGKGFIDLPSDSAALRVQIGNGFLEEGKFDQAVREYERAIAVDPKHDVAWYNLACAHARAKRIDKAIAALKKAFEVGYDDVGWMKKDPDLDNLRDAPAYRALLERLERHGPPRPTR